MFVKCQADLSINLSIKLVYTMIIGRQSSMICRRYGKGVETQGFYLQ
jgi:hypothetical protein